MSSSVAPEIQDQLIAGFIQRWQQSGAGERSNFQSFIRDLCDLLAVPRPNPARADDRDNAYVFERAVQFDDGDGNVTTKFIDLYKRGCFVMEAKQGSSADEAPNLFDLDAHTKQKRGTAVRGTARWDVAMKKAKGQALGYVQALPVSDGNPPFRRHGQCRSQLRALRRPLAPRRRARWRIRQRGGGCKDMAATV